MNMDYPSTTQALFALIVMIIVLAFILVYCCWGTFSCPRPEDLACNEDRESIDGRSQGRESPNPHAVVILPYHSMIYVGDGQTQRVYQIPIRDDKPPSYGDIFSDIPSPPNVYNSHATLTGSEPPPSYDECFHSTSNEDSWVSASQGHFITLRGGSISNSQNLTTPITSNAQLLLPNSSLQRTSSISVLGPNSLLSVASARNSHSTIYTSRPRSSELIQTVTFLSSNSPIIRTNISQSLVPIASLTSTSSNPCISSSSSNSASNFLPSLQNLHNLHTLQVAPKEEGFQNAQPVTKNESKST